MSPGGIEQVEGLVRRCWTMTGILRDMLAGEEVVGPGQTDLSAIFEELRSRFFHQAQVRKIRLEFPSWTARVLGEPVQLREALANLIANALRWSDKKEGVVTVRCGPGGTPGDEKDNYKSHEGKEVCIEVEDNGPGIPPDVLSRLFEPFVKGPTTPGRPAGTGLGLFFCKTLIEGCGGTIRAVTNPGLGTCFSITLSRVP
ncbi:MAG: HAMP domain-containing histidine kinase [Gemmataceae bacterium]|nr:HAMP domain-containing histidine kinase [Gemmataceae bacterium]